MLNTPARVAFVLASLLALAACSFKDPTVDIVDVRLLSVSVERVNTEFVVEIDNPNSVGATVTDIRYRLYVGDVKVLDESIEKNHKVAATGTTRITLPARFRTAELGALGLIAMNGKGMKYRLETEVTVKTPVGPKTFRDAQSGTLTP